MLEQKQRTYLQKMEEYSKEDLNKNFKNAVVGIIKYVFISTFVVYFLYKWTLTIHT
jgi:hypothetical protein